MNDNAMFITSTQDAKFIHSEQDLEMAQTEGRYSRMENKITR